MMVDASILRYTTLPIMHIFFVLVLYNLTNLCWDRTVQYSISLSLGGFFCTMAGLTVSGELIQCRR